MDPEIERLDELIAALDQRVTALDQRIDQIIAALRRRLDHVDSPPCCNQVAQWSHKPDCPNFTG